MLIRNPILSGFHPDPSVCRVGEDYYLVTSSFEYFPGVPIYHSTDLVNWRQIGHCLTRKSQLNLEKCPPSGGIFAPTIRYHQGTFYMITTNVTGGGNFYVTADDPAGEWSEPVFVEPGMFDPSLFFDDDGKVYYTRRGERGIVQAEIDLSEGQLTTPLQMVVEKYISPDIEGPHLYKIGGWYYLMAAEGGSRFGHGEVIGRSHSPWGPFEACPHNPILTHRHQGHSKIRDTGHAELVQDANGHWWLFCLGTRQLRYDSATLLGRETFLAPVEWTADGWPLVGEAGTIPEAFETGFLRPQEPLAHLWRDDFDSAMLDFGWNFLRNPYPADWTLSERPGHLRLRGSAVALSDWDAPAFLGRRQDDFQVRATCLLDFTPFTENEEAGLSVFMNSHYHYDLAVTKRGDERCAVVKKTVGDMLQETVSQPLPPGTVRLSLDTDGTSYRFYCAGAGGEEGLLATGLARLLCAEVAAPVGGSAIWTGIYLGMYASGNGQPCRAPADFDWFEYQRL